MLQSMRNAFTNAFRGCVGCSWSTYSSMVKTMRFLSMVLHSRSGRCVMLLFALNIMFYGRSAGPFYSLLPMKPV